MPEDYVSPEEKLVNAFDLNETADAYAEGADIDAVDEDGDTAIIRARTVEQTDFLIRAGADVNAKNKFGTTALMVATPEQAVSLIKAGADVNAADNNGSTALILSNYEKARILIAAGANVNAKTKSGLTALMVANTNEYSQMLIAAGANVNAADESGSVLQQALDKGDLGKAVLLIKAGASLKNIKDIKTPEGEALLSIVDREYFDEHSKSFKEKHLNKDDTSRGSADLIQGEEQSNKFSEKWKMQNILKIAAAKKIFRTK